MKYLYHIWFEAGRNSDATLIEVLSRLGIERGQWAVDRKVDKVDLWIPYTRELPNTLLESLSDSGYEPRLASDFMAEPSDYEQALLFQLVVMRKMVIAPAAPRNADWDLSRMCPRCGAGAEPRGGMRLNRSEIPRNADIIETGRHEHHVSDRLKDLLEAELAVGGDVVRDTEARHPGRDLPWWYLRPAHILPPLSPKSVNLIKSCPVCPCGAFGGVGIEHPLIRVYEFTREQAASLPPFSRTFEYWGESQLVEDETNRIVYSRRTTMVNRACREFFLLNGIRHVDFWPIETRVIE